MIWPIHFVYSTSEQGVGSVREQGSIDDANDIEEDFVQVCSVVAISVMISLAFWEPNSCISYILQQHIILGVVIYSIRWWFYKILVVRLCFFCLQDTT